MFSHEGYCPICEGQATFTSTETWFRDHLLCSGCSSIPRERALFKIIKDGFPNYKEQAIHESSPGGRGASVKLQRTCAGYSASQYYAHIEPGQVNPETGYRREDLEHLSFPDDSFDLFITQDVMEHVFDPRKAFAEIARVLKPGGAHIFSVPLVKKAARSERRASLDVRGNTILHQVPEYHGNPADARGSLVTMDWGYDIAQHIFDWTKMPTVIFCIDDIDLGIRAEYIDILVSHKTVRSGAPI
jgi:SAM-dependent methyltransferase